MNPSSTNRLVSAMLLLALTCVPGQSAPSQDGREHKDIVYARVAGKSLGLDIYLPTNVESPPLLVWVHGGRWMNGSKDGGVPTDFVDAGFALASLDFRQSTEARFPAMIHDIKAAVRFLRAHSGDYGFNGDRIAISGSSSGAHLATLVGVTNGHSQLEGNLGEYQSTSSDVQAIISYYGASDLTTILQQSTPYGVGVRTPALENLLGTLPEAAPELAKVASLVTHVDLNDPPLLLFHGDRDPQMPINQAHQLEGVYEEWGLDVYFDVVHGAVHGGPEFYAPDQLERAITFLKRTIGN